MKTMKLLFLGLAFVFTGLGLQAQVVQKGTLLIDGYFGFPNLYKSILKSDYADGSGVSNVKVGGLGPIGGRIEYLIADKVGIGVDVNYTSTSVTFTEFSSSANTIYNYEIARSVFRFMPRFSFHFGNSESFDGYAGVGSGYRNAKWTFDSNDPFYSGESISGIIPVAFRAFVGGRYFFSDLLGLHMEFGLGGGALIQGGLSVKL